MTGANLSAPVRVQPFTGLVIDVDTWMTAHEYHRHHHQLHLLTLHGSGVASGLEVRPTDPPSDSLVVEPGVAIDATGNVIIVPQRQRIAVEGGDRVAFVTLDYVESVPPAALSNGQEGRGRMVEDFRLRLSGEPPLAPAIELARVRTSGVSPVLALVAQPLTPGANELDHRFRPVLYPAAAPDLAIGVVLPGSRGTIDPSHVTGLYNLQRDLQRWGVRPVLSMAVGADVPTADLIYVAAPGDTAVEPKVVTAIGAQLKRGAWLFADACGPGVAFIESLRPFAGGKRDDAATQSRVLNAAHTFGAAPSGASTTHEMIWGPRAIISPRDYGCAWGGRHGEQSLARDQIRTALEFGVNVALAAKSGPGR